MRKLIMLLALAAAGASCVWAENIQKVVVTTEPQFHCDNCVAKIKNLFKDEKGVSKVEADVPTQRITITYDADCMTPEAIVDCFPKLNYKARIVTGDVPCCETPVVEEQCDGTSCSDHK